MKLKKDEYFSDDCVIEDDPIYISLKDEIICPLCSKIFKEPFMCNECQKEYCKKCLQKDSKLKICPNEKKKRTFNLSKNKNELVSKIKYRCKNCLEVVIQKDIKAHLKENCEHNEEIKREKTLAEIINNKKKLIKLNKEETLFKEISYTLTSKKILYNIIFLVYSNNIG